LVQNITTKPRKSSSAITTPAATTTIDGGGGGGGGDEATLVLKKKSQKRRVKEFDFVNFFSRGLTSSYEHRLVRPLVPPLVPPWYHIQCNSVPHVVIKRDSLSSLFFFPFFLPFFFLIS
jgi:hypothetical protein